MKTRKLVFTAILTTLALVAFSIEASLPPLTPIYGIKLGIANVFVLFALYALGAKEATTVLLLKVVLGSIFTGQVVSFMYSLMGGVLSLIVMILLKRFFKGNTIWVLSVFCAVAHNIGQISVAVILTQTIEILYYLPVLIISGIMAGAVTGLCVQFTLLHIKKFTK
jgi:heptaprenyl diphosphate synthase